MVTQNMRAVLPVLVGIAVTASAAEPPAHADRNPTDVIAAEIPAGETGSEASHMTGDWGGLRTDLVNRGLHFHAGYAGEVLGNLSGGVRRGAIYQGLLELGLDLSTEKLGLWPGGTFHVSSLYPHGSAFSAKYVGDLLTASNIDAYDSLRLYQFWFEQLFFEEKLSVRLGQLLADREFVLTERGSYFLNSAFGWPAFVSGNVLNTGPAYFVGAPGLRLRYEPAESVFVQAGLYDGDTFDSPTGDPRVNRSGTRLHLSDGQGLFAIGEAGYRLFPNEPAKLPGEYKVGVWLHSANFPSNSEDVTGGDFVVTGLAPKEHSKNYGVYATAEQMLWRESGSQGLYAIARAGASPRDRSLFEVVIDGGLVVEGMVPSRDQDVFGVGAAYARISRDIGWSERLDAAGGNFYPGFSDHETVLESFYQIRVTEWWSIQPDFQWIFNPGGTSDASDAVVVGLRTSLVF